MYTGVLVIYMIVTKHCFISRVNNLNNPFLWGLGWVFVFHVVYILGCLGRTPTAKNCLISLFSSRAWGGVEWELIEVLAVFLDMVMSL